MNGQKSACLGFVLSIFALLGTFAAPAWAQGEPVTAVMPSGETVTLAEESNSRAAQAMNQANVAQQQNQWRSLTQFDEGDVRAMFVDGTRVYAGLNRRGAFVSNDGGRTWSEAAQGLGNDSVLAFIKFGDAVYAGGLNGVYRTTNNGQNWENIGLTTLTINDFAVASDKLYVAASTGGIQRYESGTTWTALNNGLAGRSASVIEASGTALIAGFTAATNAPTLFRSTDGGQNWTAITAGLPNNGTVAVRTAGVHNNRLYIGLNFYLVSGPQVYSSADNGVTWAAFGSTAALAAFIGDGITLYSNPLMFFSSGTNFYVAVGNAHVWEDRNSLWNDAVPGGRGMPTSTNVFAVVRVGNTLLAGTTTGIYARSDDGQSWQPQNSGLKASTARVVRDGNTLVAYTQSGAIYSSTDNGQNWTAPVLLPRNGNGRRRRVTAFLATNNVWYAGGQDGSGYRSTDRGQTWIAETGLIGGSNSAPTAISLVNGKLYALMRDVNTAPAQIAFWERGTNNVWTKLTNAANIFGSGFVTSNSLIAGTANALFVQTFGEAYRSTDQGRTFTNVTLPSVPAGNTLGVEVFNNVVYAMTTLGVYRSQDHGQSWTAGRTAFNADDIVLAGTTLYSSGGSGVYFSADNGVNWTAINAGLPGYVAPNSLVANGEQIIVGLDFYGLYAATNPRTQLGPLASVSAASYASNATVAPESIVAAFGAGLATETRVASTIPLPTSLAGTSVTVRDSTGMERTAPLFFVSAGQVNYQIPAGTALGRATVLITPGSGQGSTGDITVASLAPGLFTANANGQGVVAGVVLRIRADSSLSYEDLLRFDSAAGRFVPLPIDLGAASDQLFLVLFGTGFRANGGLSNVAATVGGATTEVLFASASPDFIGVDQLNLRLPRSLAGRGEVEITLTVAGQAANRVTVAVR